MLPLLWVLSGSSPAMAATESQLAAISALGELNGVALQCSYIEQMQQIKRALVLSLPKRRELGELFEQTTNRSFMGFMTDNSVCPEQHIYVEHVGQAIHTLESAFKK